jgi:hypothetical protein
MGAMNPRKGRKTIPHAIISILLSFQIVNSSQSERVPLAHAAPALAVPRAGVTVVGDPQEGVGRDADVELRSSKSQTSRQFLTVSSES